MSESLTPGPEVRAEDSVHTSGEYGVPAMGVIVNTGIGTGGANGDYVPLTFNANGQLWAYAVQDSPSNMKSRVEGMTAQDVAVTSSQPLVTGGWGASAEPAAMSTAGDATWTWVTLSGAQVMAGYDGSAARNIHTDASGDLQVDILSGTVTANQGTAGTAWEVVGDVAHDAAAPANPVVIGAQMETQADSAPGTRAGTDADAVKLATMDGALYVAGSSPQSLHTHFDSTSAVQTDATIKAAPGAGLSIYVTDVVFSIGAATASSIFFEEGSTKVLGPWYLEAINGRGLAIQFKTPKKITANTALTVSNTGATTYSIDVGWFVAPG